MNFAPVNVVIIAGGTGGHSTRRSLFGREGYLHITSIPGTWDSGGGSGRLLTDGLIDLPPGDVCNILIAASTWHERDKEVLRHRDESGQSLINRMLVAYRTESESFAEAVARLSARLSCQGVVTTVTTHRTHLVAITESNETLHGEHEVDEYRGNLRNISLQAMLGHEQPHQSGPVIANPVAIQAIEDAHVIIIGPGSFSTSIWPNFLVPGLASAVLNSKAKVIGVANLANDAHTQGWDACRYGDSYSQLIGRSIDYLIANSGRVPDWVAQAYAQGGDRGQQTVVQVGEPSSQWNYEVVLHDFVSDLAERSSSTAGGVQRSIMRHSPQDLQVVLLKILSKAGYNRPW